MLRRIAPLALIIASFVGLAMSSWMFVQYLSQGPMVGCGPGGGCETVRHCMIAGINRYPIFSWPTIGMLGFATLTILSLASHAVIRRLVPFAAVGTAAVGITLIVLQKSVCHAESFCWQCLIVDGAAIAAGLAAIPLFRAAPASETPVSKDEASMNATLRWTGMALVAGIVVMSAATGMARWKEQFEPVKLAILPPAIAAEQRPGIATLVEFADFECPYCRRQHAEIQKVVTQYGDKIRLVRKNFPLPMHPMAEPAARAACCAEEQGRLDAMADLLFTKEDITKQGCEKIAQELSLDMSTYRACVEAPRTMTRIQRDRTQGEESGVEAVPTTFVGKLRFEGVTSSEELAKGVEQALHGG